jgi:hypothetical protein
MFVGELPCCIFATIESNSKKSECVDCEEKKT